jgi:hypothetical protein
MALRITIPPDPTGPAWRRGVLASCAGSRDLEQELRRYCNGELDGRSFLVAGLRGAGKTWLVEGSLTDLANRAGGDATRFRPLRVRLQGPQLFDVVRKDAHLLDPPPGSDKPIARQAHAAALQNARQRLFTHLLETVVFALHSALSAEFVRQFREAARQRGDDPRLHELAAQLEITLPEGPVPAEMREFWRRLDALDRGVLFPRRRGPGQGMRELAALSGLGYAYKRVAGTLQEQYKIEQKATQSQDADGKAWATLIDDVARPAVSVLAGGVVTAGSVGATGTSTAALLGLATALVSLLVFRLSGKRSRNDEYRKELTFLPKTDAASLERVLPELIDRLQRAGLTPVIVVDELDKVDDLWRQLKTFDVLDHFKKLLAERVFTCLLVNRDFMEQLELEERTDRYSRSHSYFSRRAFVAFEPGEVHDYLGRLLEAHRG